MSAIEPCITKIVLNIGAGESGDILNKAETVLTQLTGKKPVRTRSRATIPGFGIRKSQELGCKVTLRRKDAEDFLVKALEVLENTLKEKNFDNNGNFAFGIAEHIEMKDIQYDPNIGIFGMDVCVTIERPGYRVARRRVHRARISKGHRLTKDDSIKFVKEKYGVNVIGRE